MKKCKAVQLALANSACTPDVIENIWKCGRNSGLLKGTSILSLLFVGGTAIGLYFLKQYHDEEIQKAQIEAIDGYISARGRSGGDCNSPAGTEYQLAEMSPQNNWEVIVRYKPDKSKGGKPGG